MYTVNCVFLPRPKAWSQGSTRVYSSSIILLHLVHCTQNMWEGVNRKNVPILILIRRQRPKDLPLCHKSVHLCVESFFGRWRHLLGSPPSCCTPAPAPWRGPAPSSPSSNLGSEPSNTTCRSVCTAHLQILHIDKMTSRIQKVLQLEEAKKCYYRKRASPCSALCNSARDWSWGRVWAAPRPDAPGPMNLV